MFPNFLRYNNTLLSNLTTLLCMLAVSSDGFAPLGTEPRVLLTVGLVLCH